MQLSKLASIVLLGISAVTAQTNATDSTIFDLLTAPNNTLGVSNFVKLISSDPSYQPVVDALKNPGNLTCFIPNNRAVDEALKDYKEYARHHGLNSSVTFPPANTTFGNFTVLDIIKYHCADGSFELTNLTDFVSILNSTSNGSDVDPIGFGLPLLVTNNASYGQFYKENWLNNNSKDLKFEVGNGEEDADVIKKDIKATNGYLNVIDEVLVPPFNPNATIAEVDDTEAFSKILASYPEVAEYLDGLENFTLFAPNNQALRHFSNSSLSNDTVKTLVMSHIVNGTLTSIDFPQGNSTLININNQSIPLFVNGSYIRLNDTATVKERNILFNNGIMQVINKIFDAPKTNTTTNTTASVQIEF